MPYINLIHTIHRPNSLGADGASGAADGKSGAADGGSGAADDKSGAADGESGAANVVRASAFG